MPQAPAYERTINFQNNPPDRTDHSGLNNEFDSVAISIDGLRTNLGLIQKDDGSLANLTVGPEQLTPNAVAYLATQGPQGPQGIEGPQGPQGPNGPKGDVGASFVADAKGMLTERSLYNDRPTGYSFLALDQGQMYFKLSGLSAHWSTGYVFGKGEKGDTGADGQQGIQGIQGPRGLVGATGAQGPQGPAGPAGSVDYSKVIRSDSASAQSLQGTLSAIGFSASQGISAQTMKVANFDLKLHQSKLGIFNGEALAEIAASAFVSTGTGRINTGYKIANGDDIATLFDPAGTAASKVDSVDDTPLIVNIAGKSTLTLTLGKTGNKITLQVTAS